MNKIHNKKLKAYTLTELMVVLVIIGILMLIAVPNVMPLITKTHALEAQKQLKFIHALQESHYQFNFKYTQDFAELGFKAPKHVLEDGEAKYQYEVLSADQAGFRARAKAVVDFNKDGQFNIWEIDQEGNLQQTVPD